MDSYDTVFSFLGMYSSRTSLHHGHIRTKCTSASVAFLQTDMLNLFACYYWLQSVVCVLNGKSPSLNPVRTFLALSPIFSCRSIRLTRPVNFSVLLRKKRLLVIKLVVHSCLYEV